MRESFHSPRTGCFSCFEEVIRNVVEDRYFKQILLEGFSAIRKIAQNTFLLKYKTSLVSVLTELRASSLRLKRLLGTSLRCSFFGIKIDGGLFSQKIHHLAIQFKTDQILLNVAVRIYWYSLFLEDISQKWRQLKELISFLRFWFALTL